MKNPPHFTPFTSAFFGRGLPCVGNDIAVAGLDISGSSRERFIRRGFGAAVTIGLILSEHARKRMQQRRFNAVIVAGILEHGAIEASKKDIIVHLRDKQRKRRFDEYLRKNGLSPDSSHHSPYLVITTDGTIRTAGRRYKKVKHDESQRRGGKRGHRWH